MRHSRHVFGGVLALALSALATSAPALGDVTHSVVVSQTPVAWTPQVRDGRVQAITQVGNQIIVGGDFTQVKTAGGAVIARTDLFAFNATTGAINMSFAPQISGGSVFALVPTSDGSVYAAGRFVMVNGRQQRGLVKLRVADGSTDRTFLPRVGEGGVEDAELRGSRLYFGGAFATVGGEPRTGFAAVDPTTGVLDPSVNVTFAGPLTGPVDVTHFDVAPNGGRLVAAGGFTTVNGQDRAQLVQLDLTTTPISVANWETDGFKTTCKLKDGGNIRDVVFSPDSRYFVVGTEGGGAGLCDSVSRFETYATGVGRVPTWVDPTGGDSITKLAVTGTAIYAGGHQRWMENTANNSAAPGAIPRSGIAALDPVNGMPFRWNPGRDPRGTGVYAFFVNPDGLWVGSDTDYTDGLFRPRVAMFPTVGGTAVPPVSIAQLPGPLDTVGPLGVWSAPFDGAAVGTRQQLPAMASYAGAHGSFMVGNTLYSFWSDGHLYARTFTRGASDTPVDLPLNGLTAQIATVSGAFFDAATGRLYYSVIGDSNLYYRLFEPESGLLGATVTVAGRFPAQPVTMTGVGGHVYYVGSAGCLNSLVFSNGTISGTPLRLSGPPADGINWATGVGGLFVAPS